MKTPFPTRSGIHLSFALLGLALCVFSWGLQYKLSLYDPPQALSHEIPSAKLLSKEEQAEASESPLVSPGKSKDRQRQTILPAAAAFGIVSLLLGVARFPSLLSAGAWLRPERRAFRLLTGPALSAFFFRPPPAGA